MGQTARRLLWISRIESAVEHAMTTYQRTLQCTATIGRTAEASPVSEEYGSRERCQARSGADSTVAMIHLDLEVEES